MTFQLTLDIEKVTVVRRKGHMDSISFTIDEERWYRLDVARLCAEDVLDELGIPPEYIEIIDVDKIQEARWGKPPTFSKKGKHREHL